MNSVKLDDESASILTDRKRKWLMCYHLSHTRSNWKTAPRIDERQGMFAHPVNHEPEDPEEAKSEIVTSPPPATSAPTPGYQRRGRRKHLSKANAPAAATAEFTLTSLASSAKTSSPAAKVVRARLGCHFRSSSHYTSVEPKRFDVVAASVINGWWPPTLK